MGPNLFTLHRLSSLLHSFTVDTQRLRESVCGCEDGRSTRGVWSWRKGLQGKTCSSLCRWNLWSLSLRPCPFSWASQKSVTFFFFSFHFRWKETIFIILSSSPSFLLFWVFGLVLGTCWFPLSFPLDKKGFFNFFLLLLWIGVCGACWISLSILSFVSSLCFSADYCICCLSPLVHDIPIF